MTGTKVVPRLTTPELTSLVLARFAPPEWATFTNVAAATGGGTRLADAVAMNLWRSRGHAVLGFEVKRDRSDWLRELKSPEKADAVGCYCDEWYIVANPDVVQDGELPKGWGLLVPRGSSLVTVRPSVRAEREERKLLSMPFIAALLRRACEQGPTPKELAAEYQRGVKVGTERAEQQAALRGPGREDAELRREVEGYRALARSFQARTGIHLAQWTDGENLAEFYHAWRGVRNIPRYDEIVKLATKLRDAVMGLSLPEVTP